MSEKADVTSGLVIRERRSPAAHATIIGGAIVAVLALGAICAIVGYRTGHDARSLEVETLAAAAEEAKVKEKTAIERAEKLTSNVIAKAEADKSSAIAQAEADKSYAIARAEAEKSDAIAEIESRAQTLLKTSEKTSSRMDVENRLLREHLVILESDLTTEREAAARQKESLDGLERQFQIDRAAYDELKSTLESSSGDLAQLRDELNFYRSILSPEGQKAGVQIQDFILKETEILNQYQYRLTLIQARKHETNVRGVVNIEIEGSQNGIGKIVDVAIFGTPPGRADFKYYQHLQGIFDLPEDFAATGVRVIVKSDLAGTPVEQWYPWPQS